MYKLSPSDFAFLWTECKHCYYQKVKYGIASPGIFPSMFGRINNLLQNSIMGMNLQDVHPSLPSGIIEIKEGYLKSKPFPHAPNVYVSGRFDILSRLDDGTYSVIDFKITTPEEDKILKKYTSQLHAYKYALENPLENKPIKISKMGIVSVNPNDMKLVNGRIIFTAQPTFHPVKEDVNSFFALIGEISSVLNGPVPAPSLTCNLCKYRTYFSHPSPVQTTDIPF